MRILVINHYAGSPGHGMEYRPYFMAREWVRRGHDVTIVAASFSHLRTTQPTVKGLVTEQEIEGIRYVWLRTPSYHGHVARVVNILAFIFSLGLLALRFSRKFRPDAVIASSTYPADIFPAFLLARLSGARLAYEVHDIWPLSPMELGGMSRWHPFILAMQFAEDFCYRVVDVVISLLPAARAHMVSRGMPAWKFHCVPNGVCLEEWTASANQSSRHALPAQHREIIDALRRRKRFIVGYAGGHGLSNALDTLIEAADMLRDLPVSFLLVGQGPQRQRLMDMALQRGLEEVHLLPAVPRAAVPALLQSFDVAYVGFRKLSIHRFGISPNKLMDYMMAGKPVLQAIDAGNDMTTEAGCGVSVPADDSSAVACAIRHLIGQPPEALDQMGRRGQAFIREHHDYARLAERFLEVVGERSRGVRSSARLLEDTPDS